MALKYFGTDGIRGKFGGKPMTIDFALKVGNAAARKLVKRGGTIVIGRDTRLSGPAIEAALAAGIQAAGVSVQLAGILPTPGVAHVTKKFEADLGIVVSASHNAYYDNGIKFFNGAGSKLNDEQQKLIEQGIDDGIQTNGDDKVGLTSRIQSAGGVFREFVERSLNGVDLNGMKVVIDAGHGAMYRIAPQLFQDQGARVFMIGVQPDGKNINAKCGSTYTRPLEKAVKANDADIGFAFDGDGDRLVAVDHKGETVDGDELLFIFAMHAQAEKKLKGPIVGTSMSNLGLEKMLLAKGIGFERARVGDKHVLERLTATGGTIGGETSGHIILLDYATTGDGLMAAAQLVRILKETGKSLHELKKGFRKFPQVIVNVKVKEKRKAMESPKTEKAIQIAQKQLGLNGRIVLRPSGTEPVIRVMVESEDVQQTERLAKDIAKTIESLGV